jgi:hypothetical protein
MRMFFSAFVLAAALVIPATASAELKLTMENGLVTLVAKDVPLSMIMAEWAKVGRTNILNGDKILTLVTIQLEGIPERKVLDILLRGAAGYMLAERATPVAGASTFDRIMILPTSRPPANAPPLQQASPQPFGPPRPMPMPVQVQPDEEEPRPGNVPPTNPAQLGQPGAPQPGAPQPGATQPGAPNMPQAPLTAPRPGMLQPPPQQPVPFGAPRPGGGGAPTTPAGPGGGGGGGD